MTKWRRVLSSSSLSSPAWVWALFFGQTLCCSEPNQKGQAWLRHHHDYVEQIAGSVSLQGSIIQNVLNQCVLTNPKSAHVGKLISVSLVRTILIFAIKAMQSADLLRQTPPEVRYVIRQAYGVAFSKMMIVTIALVAVRFLELLELHLGKGEETQEVVELHW